MKTQAEVIDALGGHREVAAHLAPFFEKDGRLRGKPHERVRKWKEANHIPADWRYHVRALALKAGFKLSDLPAEMLLPEEVEEPQGDAAA